MPEIDVFLFDLKHLLKLFPKMETQDSRDIEDYEYEVQDDMLQIRINLFSGFGYDGKAEKVLSL